MTRMATMAFFTWSMTSAHSAESAAAFGAKSTSKSEFGLPVLRRSNLVGPSDALAARAFLGSARGAIFSFFAGGSRTNSQSDASRHLQPSSLKVYAYVHLRSFNVFYVFLTF